MQGVFVKLKLKVIAKDGNFLIYSAVQNVFNTISEVLHK